MKNFVKSIELCSEIDRKAFENACKLNSIAFDKNIWDIRNVLNISLEGINCIVAGFPCQSISSIGAQGGFMVKASCGHTFSALDVEEHGVCPICGTEIKYDTETPSSLVSYLMIAIQKAKPALVVIENVANWVSKRFRGDFDKVKSKIESFGYNIYWDVLNAFDYGSVQHRRRVIMVCVRSDVDSKTFHFPKPYGIKRDMQSILDDCSHVFANTDAKVVIGDDIPPYILPALEEEIDAVITSTADTYKLKGKNGWTDRVISLNKITTLRASNSTCLVRQIYTDSNGEKRYYIRNLSPAERWRATGFTTEDYELVSQTTGKTHLNHQTGNSISVEMLVAVWLELFVAMPYLFTDLKLFSAFTGIGAFERSLDILYEEINL